MAYQRQQISVGFSSRRVLAGSHVCYIYSTDEERIRLLARFLAAGQQANEQLLYATGREDLEALRRELAGHGLHAPEAQLCITHAEQTYLEDGSFSPERMLELLQAFYEESRRAGYSGARGTGEMAWAAQGCAGSERAMEYEARLTECCAEYPYTALCQYDARLFSGSTLMDVLSVHPYMIVRGQLVENPYFIEPKEFLLSQGRPCERALQA